MPLILIGLAYIFFDIISHSPKGVQNDVETLLGNGNHGDGNNGNRQPGPDPEIVGEPVTPAATPSAPVS